MFKLKSKKKNYDYEIESIYKKINSLGWDILNLKEEIYKLKGGKSERKKNNKN